MGFFSTCLCVLINSQSPRCSECTRQYILARRGQANMRVSNLSPAARNRQENLGRLLHKRRLLLQRKHQISVPPCLRGQRSKFPASYTKSRQSCVGVLPPPPGSVQSCESLLRSSGDSVDYAVSDHHRTAYVYCSGPNHGQTFHELVSLPPGPVLEIPCNAAVSPAPSSTQHASIAFSSVFKFIQDAVIKRNKWRQMPS